MSSPISLRESRSAAVHKDDHVTIGVPQWTAAGDLLVAVIAAYGPPTITTPAGWTLGRNDGHMAIYWRAATANEPSSYTWKFDSEHAAIRDLSFNINKGEVSCEACERAFAHHDRCARGGRSPPGGDRLANGGG